MAAYQSTASRVYTAHDGGPNEAPKWRQRKPGNIADTRSCQCVSGRVGVRRLSPRGLIYPSLHNFLYALWHRARKPPWPKLNRASTTFSLPSIGGISSPTQSGLSDGEQPLGYFSLALAISSRPKLIARIRHLAGAKYLRRFVPNGVAHA